MGMTDLHRLVEDIKAQVLKDKKAADSFDGPINMRAVQCVCEGKVVCHPSDFYFLQLAHTYRGFPYSVWYFPMNTIDTDAEVPKGYMRKYHHHADFAFVEAPMTGETSLTVKELFKKLTHNIEEEPDTEANVDEVRAFIKANVE